MNNDIHQSQDITSSTHFPERAMSPQTPTSPSSSLSPPDISRTSSGSFSKSFTSMMGGLSSLSLARTSTREHQPSHLNLSINSADKEKEARGRTIYKLARVKSASQVPDDDGTRSRSRARTRSVSPFSFRRFRNRDVSPFLQAIPLNHSDVELSDCASSRSARPRTTAFGDDSGDEFVGEETEDEDGSDDEFFDPVTERNTNQNAIISQVPPDSSEGLVIDPDVDVDPDPLGEGVNVVVPPEPYFPSTLNGSGISRGRRNPRRRKSTKIHEPLPFRTARPVFLRDRCTISFTQGDPDSSAHLRKKRKYLVGSDLSEESRYAMEWAIGTVLRDGDELILVHVLETDTKIDPTSPTTAINRTAKLRSQQERQGVAYILVRQATSLVQRTKLNVTVSCQAWHAKNARHMLLDIVDNYEPTMVIVGSRGLGRLKGILLGSTSHYLIQKSSVPVMVARRRLKRPPKRSAHLSTNRTHVTLAEAAIDSVVHKVDEDVKVMRDEIAKDSQRRTGKGLDPRNGSPTHVIGEEEDMEEVDMDEVDDEHKAMLNA